MDVNGFVGQTLASFENNAQAANVKIQWNPADKLPSIRMDELWVGEAIAAIVTNAIEAMPEGGRLDVQTRLYAENNMVAVLFRDTGKGIPTHLMNKVFQAYLSGKKDHKGLGLTICRRVMDLHRGKIVVDNPSGYGALIELLFPVAETEKP